MLSFAGFEPTPREAAIAPSPPPPAFLRLGAGAAGRGGGTVEAVVVEGSEGSAGAEGEGSFVVVSGPKRASSEEEVESGTELEGIVEADFEESSG